MTTKHKTTRYVSKAETRRREEIAKQGLLDAEGIYGCGSCGSHVALLHTVPCLSVEALKWTWSCAGNCTGRSSKRCFANMRSQAF